MKTPDRRALRRIELKNLLSFGPDSPALDLENLNILIGPNGSGKSNLIEAISLLRSTPMSPASKMDMRNVLSQGGGSEEWIWKGRDRRPAVIETTVCGNAEQSCMLRHRLVFSSELNRFRLDDEAVFNGTSGANPLYSLEDGALRIDATRMEASRNLAERAFRRDGSVLSNLRDPATFTAFPELTQLVKLYESIRIYREWPFGRNISVRSPQQLDQLDDHLDEEFSNLVLFLRRLKDMQGVSEAILARLKDLYQGVTDYDFHVDTDGGTVQLVLQEGSARIPAKRLSDGTLHYLCLLAILCDPNPPPLICIEEPEIGLHPDILPKLADLLIEASGRTQLIVTTHSDALVDAMTSRPESVVVCEKRDGQTHMKRLSKAELKPWLQEYRLGQLWASGEIGGNRW